MTEQLFGWNEQTWLYLDQTGILIGNIMLFFSIGAVLVGWLQRDSIRKWFSKNHFPNIGGKPEGADWQGLIFTVSRAELPLWVIEQVQPKWIGLLMTEHSQSASEHIQESAKKNGFIVNCQMINNADDPQDVFKQTKILLQQMKDNGIKNIAVDITGGKVPMSLGAFMAAEEGDADSLYVSTEFEKGKPNIQTARIVTVSKT